MRRRHNIWHAQPGIRSAGIDLIDIACNANSPMNQILLHTSRIRKQLTTNGLGGLASLACKNLPGPVRRWMLRRRIENHRQFDSIYGVDTQAPVGLSELERSAPAWLHAVSYTGTPIAVAHKIIRKLPIDFNRFTFIDLGSGKGRVLLIASQYPFSAVVGVEFSRKLHDIAVHNIAAYSNQRVMRSSILPLNMDARNLDFSRWSEKVVFCFNPFAAPVMHIVLDNLEHVSSRQGAETFYVYLGPMVSELKDRLNAFPMILRGEWLSEFGYFEQYALYKLQ